MLSLPAEVRNRVYYFTLGGNTLYLYLSRTDDKIANVLICSAETPDAETANLIQHSETGTEIDDCWARHEFCNPHSEDATPTYSLPLLQTCSQVHNEAALVPFRENTFTFGSKLAFATFLKQLMPTQQRAIVSITLLDFDNASWLYRGTTTLLAAKALKGLRYLRAFVGVDGDITSAEFLSRSLITRLDSFQTPSLLSPTICIYHAAKRLGGTYIQTPACTDPDRFDEIAKRVEQSLLISPMMAEIPEGKT